MTPGEALAKSRKVTLAKMALVPIVIVVLLAEVLVFVQALRGKLDVQAAIGLMFAGILSAAAPVVILIWKTMDGIEKEDVARINAGSAPEVDVVKKE